jgi:hypothetical protein
MKTSELSGVQLDWAVAQIERKEVNFECNLLFLSGSGFTYGDIFRPSADWECGGPIIERESIGLDFTGNSIGTGYWFAKIFLKEQEKYVTAFGTTPLVAAMRCYVASKLGSVVEIPKEVTNE